MRRQLTPASVGQVKPRWSRIALLRGCLPAMGLAVAGLLAAVMPTLGAAQNLIANPGFEDNPPPNFGNNIGWSFTPWVLGPGDQSNVVKVDGPGGYNYGNSGPQSDASNNGAGAGAGVAQHYADIVGVNSFYQSFVVPTCGAAAGQTRTLTYSGWFSGRDNQGGNGSITIRQGVGIGGAALSTKTVTVPASASSATAPWIKASGTVTVASGSTVSFVVTMDNPVNFDEAYMSFSTVTCASAPLTLRKTWSNATINDTAKLTATRNGSIIDTFTAKADSANETDTDATPVTVFQGETITLAEAVTSSATYAQTLVCSGGGTLSGNVLIVGTSAVPIVCTYTNSLPVDLAITKKTNTSPVIAGQPVSYTITATNGGPGSATGAVVKDTPVSGVTCPPANTVTCAGVGCPVGAITVGALLSPGITMGTQPANSSATLTFSCTAN